MAMSRRAARDWARIRITLGYDPENNPNWDDVECQQCGWPVSRPGLCRKCENQQRASARRAA